MAAIKLFHESPTHVAGAGFKIRRKGERWYWSLSRPCRLGSSGVASHRDIALREVRRRLAEGAAETRERRGRGASATRAPT